MSTLYARDAIQIVGSSTVYGFSAVVAEHHGWQEGYKTPVVESLGTGGGLKRFCEGVGKRFPDIANASRAIKSDELAVCKKNGVTDIVEFTFGYDGIVIANGMGAPQLSLKPRDLFLAMAKYVPSRDGSHTVVDNPYTHWHQINDALPESPILIYGPPSSSGTQEALRSLVLKNECIRLDWLNALSAINPERFASACTHLREDGHYLSVGENDHISVQRVSQSESAIGVFGYGVFQRHENELQPAVINGFLPEPKTIATGRYPFARPLYFYVKTKHTQIIEGLSVFVKRFLSDDMVGPNGVLLSKGLVPLQPQSLGFQREKLNQLSANKFMGALDAAK